VSAEPASPPTVLKRAERGVRFPTEEKIPAWKKIHNELSFFTALLTISKKNIIPLTAAKRIQTRRRKTKYIGDHMGSTEVTM
jgi:hypothetical protein